jgi:DNA processing protein
VQVLGRGLPGYPAALEALGDPPAVLWVRGELPELAVVPHAVGVVGTRAASGHALNLTHTVATELSAAGVVIVSGLARGIDTAAHRAAVMHGGPSIGVVGTGVDLTYPGENAGLARQLCVLSEYPLGTRPAAHNFPMRNRLIAALSAGTLVVEGELKSGSLITAGHALECGRTVFAVPGRAGDPLASGPHRLLREGAVLAECAADILTELGWAAGPAIGAPELPGEQRRIWEALTQPATLDDLLALTGTGAGQVDAGELQLALTMLTMGGHVEEQGGRYVRR